MMDGRNVVVSDITNPSIQSNINLQQTDDLIFYLPAAKKLGGKLDVVSYHDEVEGRFLIPVQTI